MAMSKKKVRPHHSPPTLDLVVHRSLMTNRTQEARNEFLIHLRYNFHNPPLTFRDYTAIEHQVGGAGLNSVAE